MTSALPPKADIETTLSVSYPLRSAKLRALCATDRAVTLVTFVNKIKRSGTKVIFAAARPPVRRTLIRAGLKPPLVSYAAVSSAHVTE
jgi:hypothetical protein